MLLVRGEAGYPLSFAVLAVPAVLALGTLMAARYLYPNPRDLEVKRITLERKGLSRVYWLYLAAVACVAAGYADFPLIAYHLQRTDVAPAAAIPVFYAVAMGVDAIAALIFGRLFDRHGIPVLAGGVLVSLFFAPLAFSQSFGLAVVGMVLWGVGMGAQESVLRAAIGDLVASDRRGSAYGIFNTAYGVAWFLGSAVMGVLYDQALVYLVIFSIVMQAVAVPLLFLVRRELRREPPPAAA